MQSLRRTLDSIGLSLGGHAHSRSNWASPIRRPILITVAAMAVLSLMASWWIGRTVLHSTQQITRESLQSILSANVAMLQDWLETQQANVVAAASQKSVQDSACTLIAKSELDFQWDREDLDGLSEFATLKKDLRSDEYLGWSITNTQDVVVASSIDSFVGQTLSIPDHVRRSIMARQPSVFPPMKSPVVMEADGPLSILEGPIMGAMTPILSNNNDGDKQIIGSLVLLINPLDRFSELLTIARTGTSGETYAFDGKGVLLTQSRFEDQLRNAKMLPEDPRVVSPLNVVVRDPGVNVVMGNRPTISPSEQRLTVMADHATRGGSGDNLTGYNDYRGVQVVGAWAWLPDYQMGVATEADLDEAFAPVRFLNRGFYALLSMLALSTLGLLFFAWKEAIASRITTLRQSGKADTNRRRFGRYELGEILGRGGMGSVYRGKHELLRRPVAIKVLSSDDTASSSRPSAASQSGVASSVSPDSITRFEREVQLTASLRHPNTIDVYDYGRADDGTFFYVMEFIDGITLQQLIDDFGAQPPARVIHLLLQICGSLREAHRNGLVHRDVKPANILLTSEAGVTDWIKVLDFGLIKSMTPSKEDQLLTQSDTITGTPMYMSPECVRDATTSDALSDLYSLGAVGYALLTGKSIFDGTGSVDICMKQLNEQPIRPENRLKSSLPEDLQNVLMSCLRKDPMDRPQSIDELASTLRSCNDAMAWTESDAIQWWEVVYTERSLAKEANRFPDPIPGSDDHETLDNDV